MNILVLSSPWAWAWALQKRVKYLDTACLCVCVCTSAGPIFINCVILALYMFGLYSTLRASFTRLFSVDTGACSVLFSFVVLCCVCLCLLHSVYYLFALQCSQCSNCTAKHIHKYVDMCVCVDHAEHKPNAKSTENRRIIKEVCAVVYLTVSVRSLATLPARLMLSSFSVKFGNFTVKFGNVV